LLLLSLNLIHAQNTNNLYKLEARDQPLGDVLYAVQNDYGWLFSYKESDVSPFRVSVSIETKSREVFLDRLLAHTDIGYEIVDDQFILLSPLEEITVCGKLIDETGQPLIGATVMVSSSGHGTVSDTQGYFSLTQKLAKSQTLELSYVGYNSRSVLFSDYARGNCPDIILELPTIEMPWLIITDYLTDGISKNTRSSSTLLNPSKIKALPGQTEPDVLKTIQFLPGVASPSSKSSDLFVRGGTPDQNLVLWEDIPIYHSAHYFGMISAIDPFIVDEVEVYRGGFGPEYGGRVSSVIDMESIDESSQASRLRVGSNMTHSYISGIEKLGSSKKTAVVYSLRRSFSDLVKTPTYNRITAFNQQGFVLDNIEVTELPDHVVKRNDFRFLDGHIKMCSQLTDKDKTELSGIWASTNFAGEIVDDNLGRAQRDSMKLRNLGASFNWDRQWFDKLNTSIVAIYTDYNYNYAYRLKELNMSQPRDEGLKSNGIKDRQLQAVLNYQLADNQSLEGGYHFENYDIVYELKSDNQRNNRGGDSQLGIHSGFLNYGATVYNNFKIDLGLRASILSERAKTFVEPRLRVAYGLSEGLVLSGAYGRHNQYISQVSEFAGSRNGLSLPLWGLSADSGNERDITVPIQSANQYQLGLIYDKKSWLVDLQAYTKKIDGFSSRSYDIDDQLKLGQLDLSLGLKWSSGLPFSTAEDFRIDNNVMPPREVVTYNGVNNARLPIISEWNFSAQYQFSAQKSKWKGFLSFSVVNILDRHNVNSLNYFVKRIPGEDSVLDASEKMNLRLTPDLSLRFEW